jgi:hypothetical protein
MPRKPRIPDPLTRRHLVERELEPSRARALAEAYLADDRVIEAVAFLLKAGDRERLASLRDAAAADGDVFLLREVAAALGEEIDAATWRAAADGAAAAGKDHYANEARRLAAALEG